MASNLLAFARTSVARSGARNSVSFTQAAKPPPLQHVQADGSQPRPRAWTRGRGPLGAVRSPSTSRGARQMQMRLAFSLEADPEQLMAMRFYARSCH